MRLLSPHTVWRRPAQAVAAVAFLSVIAQAARPNSDSADVASAAVRYGEPVTVTFRVGAEVSAVGGPCRDIFAMVALPLECAEQAVRPVSEEFTPEIARVEQRELQGGAARQVLISIPRLAGGSVARAVLTFEVTTRPVLPPTDEEIPTLHSPQRTPMELRRFVGPSPFIESRSPQVKRMARKVLADLESATPGEQPSDWSRVEAFYDHVLDSIQYAEGDDTSALQTIKDGIADCHGRTALFVALCRSIGVPARVVWAQDHCYPEFYLEDAQGRGRWLPAESAGTRAFGEMPITRPILQKGDDFRVPERPRDRLRYASDFLIGVPLPGSSKPSVRYIREIVGDNPAAAPGMAPGPEQVPAENAAG